MLKEGSLSIGILAHNEESNIEALLRSLFSQDVFQKVPAEIVIVANGCTDKTATIARQSLADHQAVWSDRGSARVEELTVSGKTNAWNQYVHTLSSPLASILVLMDADITLLSSNVISSMVTTLDRSSQAVVCVDRPVKDIEITTKRTFLQRLLVAATPKIDTNNVPLCGQLYCALSAQLRQIVLPVELPVEDGFLRALLVTDGFTKPENAQRIILDSTASHCFASVATIRELFKHEKWIVSSSVIAMLLFERFWNECTADCSAMTLMERWQEQDPEWLPHYVQQQVRRRGWRLLPRDWWTRRWWYLQVLPLHTKIQKLPVAAIAAIFDAFIFLAAIRDVRGGRAFRYWGRK